MVAGGERDPAPPRSDFSRSLQNQVQGQCERLIRGFLKEDATAENVDISLGYFLLHLKEHRCGDTVPAQVNASFERALEKLRVHSQLEVADYLEAQHAAFLRCSLSDSHTHEAHAAVLRALLSLARHEPATKNTLDMVRAFRRIGDDRRTRAAEQRRRAAEHAHDRMALVELELLQIAETATREWDEAWSEPDPDALPLAGGDHGARITPLSPLAPADRRSCARASELGPWAQGADAQGNPRSPSTSSRSQAPAMHAAAAMVAAPSARLLSRGTLPRPPWHSSASRCQRFATENADALGDRLVSEPALVQMALQLLSGQPVELVETTNAGGIRWRRCLRTQRLSAPALGSILAPMAALAAALRHLRCFALLLQAISPPVGDERLLRGLTQALQAGRLGLREIAQLIDPTRGTEGPDSDRSSPLEDTPVLLIFGLCWQSFGLSLDELLDEFAVKLRHLQADFYHTSLAEAESLRKVGGGSAPLTLMSLEKWLAPHSRPVFGVWRSLHCLLDATARACAACDPAQWPTVAAETLVAHWARACGGAALAGDGNAWLERLWRGALWPVLRVLGHWGTTGEFHDPCGEFRGLTQYSPDGAECPLVPQAVAAAGWHVRSLGGWASKLGPSGVAASASRARLLAGSTAAQTEGVSAKSAPSWPRAQEAAISLRGRFIPIDVALEAQVLGPQRLRCEAVARPLLVGVLANEEEGLLRHLAALRAVAFLEREDIVGSLVQRIFGHIRRRTTCRRAQGSLAIELNAALAEGLDTGLSTTGDAQASAHGSLGQPMSMAASPASTRSSVTLAKQLCARHLVIAVLPGDACDPDSEPWVAFFDCLALRYTAPAPLDLLVDAEAVRAYSSVMAWLLRVQYARAAVLNVQELPLFNAFDRKQRQLRAQLPPHFAHLVHGCDLLRAELLHFLVCLEQYLRIDVFQENTRLLERHLCQLVETGALAPPTIDQAQASSQSCSGFDSGVRRSDEEWGLVPGGLGGQALQDVMRHVRRLHSDYLHRLLHECFLTPDLRTVRADVESLVGLGVELRDTLTELVQSVLLDEGTGVGAELSDAARAEDEAFAPGASRQRGGASAAPELVLRVGAREMAVKLAAVSARVSRIQREFRSRTKYLLQVLTFSVARGGARQVANFCSQLNGNRFYSQDT